MPVLLALWLTFAALFGGQPCLTPPTLRLVADAGPAALGRYEPASRTVFVESGLGGRMLRLVAVHEFAHHYSEVCRVDERPLGRRFLRQAGLGGWGRDAEERFAHTLAWVITGQGLSSGMVERQAASVFAGRLVGADREQRARMGVVG